MTIELDKFLGLDYQPEETETETETEADEDVVEDEEEVLENSDDGDKPEETEVEQEQDLTQEEEQPKKVQTPEENAYFAQRRREQQLQQRLQEELQKRPEYQLAQVLSQMYGMPPEQLVEQIKEAQLRKEAQEKNLPIELLRERQQFIEQNRQLEERLNRTEFNIWLNNVQAEKAKLIESYPMLTDDDLNQAVQYMLGTLQRVDLPLEQVVLSLHGKKIITSLQEKSTTEALAKVSGRAKGPLAPQGGKPASVETLSEEEREIARKMGISEKDYLKYKKKTSL